MLGNLDDSIDKSDTSLFKLKPKEPFNSNIEKIDMDKRLERLTQGINDICEDVDDIVKGQEI